VYVTARFGNNTLVVTAPNISLQLGAVGLRTYRMAAAFDFVLIIQRRNKNTGCPPRE
jgi:hypothetical protein